MFFLAQAAQSATSATTSTGNAAAADEQARVIVPRLFERIDALAHPDTLVSTLEQTGVVIAAIFVAVGLTCLLQGYKLYKGVVLIMALAVGVFVGYKLGQSIQAEIIAGGCLGVLLAVIAWPFMKFAVSLCGGLAGAFIGANAWSAIAEQVNANSAMTLPPDAYWAGALMGLILLGLLSFILFELSVVVFTSISGSTLAVLGIIALLLQVPAWRNAVADAIQANPLVVPMLVVVPAVIGLVLQQQMGGLKKAGG